MAISKFWLDAFRGIMGVGGGLGALQSLSTIKKGTSPLNFHSNEPFWSFYDNSFYKNFICLPGITYNPCPEGCGGIFIVKDLISRTFNYVEKKWLSQNFDWMCLGKRWAWEGDSLPSNYFRLLKRALALLISNRMSLFEVSTTTPIKTLYAPRA